ncbi:MAG: hypothetical protein IAF08_08515 [Rhizobacter sp.]|nr:hypothetical protein [Chlorobiales bacterium]
MAKKQSFGDKNSKKAKEAAVRTIKLVYSTKSQKTGEWRFAEKFVKIPAAGDEGKLLEEEIRKG